MGYKHKATDVNPWGLTLAESQVMRALVQLGCIVAVASKFRIHRKTAQNHLNAAMAKMGVTNRVLAAVAWDRRVREDHAEIGKRLNSVFALGTFDPRCSVEGVHKTTGEVVRFESQVDAEAALSSTGKRSSSIHHCLSGKQKSAYGFVWGHP